MTDRLYERDSYCRSFTAIVKSCEATEGVYNVVLNRTAFFPEGGGQAADVGTLNGVSVLDVQRKGDLIIHKTVTELPIGTEVKGEIDWELRYSRMQSHTGEHILSGVVYSLFGYNNIGFHMGENFMTVDFDGILSQKDIEIIELNSNRSIYKNVDIVVSYPTEKELTDFHYRSKIDFREDIRIVTIGDIDCCACCAPHLAKTGETGIIKIINSYPYKKGTRIELVAGISALKDYSELNFANRNIMRLLSAPRSGVEVAVCEQNISVNALRSENMQLLRRLALYELERVIINDSIYALTKDLSYDELRYCANSLVEHEFNTCVLFSKNDADSFIYVASSQNKDVRLISLKLNNMFNGKGGGKENYVQGRINFSSEEKLRLFVEELLKEEV